MVSMQPEQGPLLAYHLEDLGGAPKLRFANAMGAVKNDRVMDWTDGYDRMKDADPGQEPRNPCLLGSRVGGRVLIVHPVTSRNDDWDAPWTQLVRRRSAQWGARTRHRQELPAGSRRARSIDAPPASGCAALSTRRPRCRRQRELPDPRSPAPSCARSRRDPRRRPRRPHRRLPALEAGLPVIVLEAEDQVGGIAKTAVRGDGYRFDLGGHRFFTKVTGGRRPLARDHERGVPPAPAHVAHLLARPPRRGASSSTTRCGART